MSVLDRSELEQSHLADLHAIASELGIEGYRRLGRDALIDAILAGDGGGGEQKDEPVEEDEPAEKPRGRGRRRGLRRGRKDEDADEVPASDEKDDVLGESDGDDGAEVVIDEGDDAESAADEPKQERKEREPEDVRTGVLDILPGGSGFMRADP